MVKLIEDMEGRLTAMLEKRLDRILGAIPGTSPSASVPPVQSPAALDTGPPTKSMPSLTLGKKVQLPSLIQKGAKNSQGGQ